MRKKLYTMDEINKAINKKAKQQEKKVQFTKKVQNAMEFVVKNLDIIMFAAPIVVGVAKPIRKFAAKTINNRQVRKTKDLYCYDRSLGHYWALRRELTNKEWITIEKRKKNGERLGDILYDLKVLK